MTETTMERIITFITQISVHPFREEIIGGLIVIFLLLLIRRRRKKKAVEYEGHHAPPDQTAKELSIDEGTYPPEVEDALKYEFDDEAPDAEENRKLPPSPPAEGKIREEIPEPAGATPTGLFDRLKNGLSKTRMHLSRQFEGILSGNRAISDDMMEAIEETLITADVGMPTTMELMGRISRQSENIKGFESFTAHLKKEMLSFVNLTPPAPLAAKPYVIMMVGVNGAGKTTSIGKLASRYTAEGKKVLLAAADTFRAAAADQLSIWADRAGAEIVRHRDNADPAAVAYDAIEAAIARGTDVVIVDTAGRLQTKVNLMEQLKKIKRTIDKALPGAPHEVMLVLDATTGQNAVSQARLFDEGIGVSGIILAKLDGTAKGGIVISICHTLKIPIRYIGIGEAIEDLQSFDPERFIDALL